MFRNFYDVENPMVIDSLWCKNYVDDDEEIVFDIDIVIDTRKLDIEDENHLVNAIEDASYSRGKLRIDCADMDFFVDEDDGEKWNMISISGYVKEYALDKIYDVINSYNVKFIKEKVKEI